MLGPTVFCGYCPRPSLGPWGVITTLQAHSHLLSLVGAAPCSHKLLSFFSSRLAWGLIGQQVTNPLPTTAASSPCAANSTFRLNHPT